MEEKESLKETNKNDECSNNGKSESEQREKKIERF
jgi:hypothetical protein